jgi:adenylosuccinate synthase
MMLDVLSELDEIKICVAYECVGERLASFPADSEILRRVQPVYETLPGWKLEITEVTQWSDLPEPAKAYVRRIEQLVGGRVGFISVGPDRRQTIFVDNVNGRQASRIAKD